MNTKIKEIARISIIASLYVLLTILNPFSYDTVQFRISEILMFLCCFKKEYILGLTIGCFISNFFSSMMLYDIIFGPLATLISAILMYKTKNIFISWIYPVIFNAIIVGLELTLVFNSPYLINLFWVGFGELVVMIIGLIIFLFIRKKDYFKELFI